MDWRQWHADYDDPGSMLSRRLTVVRARLAEALDALPDRDVRLLSLCAGEARDVIPVLHAHQAGPRVRGVVVELDPVLAGRASDAARLVELGNVEVRCADAGDVDSFRDVLPVDVLLLCGIFGNVQRDVVHQMVERVPAMVSGDGYVIWTRGGHAGDDDPRSEVRRWFVESGMPERSFDGPADGYGVGVNQVPTGGTVALGDARLFDFSAR